MLPTVKNLLFFKIGWVACVGGAAQGLPWLGAVVVFIIAIDHLRTATLPRNELKLLIAAAMFGLIWDSSLVWFEVLKYPNNAMVAPYWIVSLWVLFATTLNLGMRWLQKHWAIAMLVGALGGPMSFFAGAKLGAVTLAHDSVSLLIIGAGWAVVLPLLVQVAKRLSTHTSPPPTAHPIDSQV